MSKKIHFIIGHHAVSHFQTRQMQSKTRVMQLIIVVALDLNHEARSLPAPISSAPYVKEG